MYQHTKSDSLYVKTYLAIKLVLILTYNIVHFGDFFPHSDLQKVKHMLSWTEVKWLTWPVKSVV